MGHYEKLEGIYFLFSFFKFLDPWGDNNRDMEGVLMVLGNAGGVRGKDSLGGKFRTNAS